MATSQTAVRPPVVVQNALPPELLRLAQQDAAALAGCPNYWLTADAIRQGAATTVAEQVVIHLFNTLVKPRLEGDEGWAGAEVWVQVYKGGRGLGFHFDKDEHAMKERGEMVCPIYSSVLYLTGTAGPHRQSPTVIVDQRFDAAAGATLPANPTQSLLVFPLPNHYVLFDGTLGHGVLDSPHGTDTRATLLVNWWASKPEAVNPVKLDDIEQHKLTTAAAAADRTGDSSGLCGCSAGCTSTAGVAVTCHELDVCAEQMDEDAVLMVDDLLAQHGLSVISHDASSDGSTPAANANGSSANGSSANGSSANGSSETSGSSVVHAVHIRHPGLSLYPIDHAQLQDAEEVPLVAAALVPLAAFSSDEE